MGDSELSIVIRAKNEASTILSQVRGDVEKMGSGSKKAFDDAVGPSKALALGVAAAGAAVVGFGISSVKAYNEAQAASAQLDAVLKSTAGAAGMSKDALMDQASALQAVTKYSDEAVQGAQAMLLTFTNIKGQVFQDSIPLILDMATALGMDASQAAMQFGKALNDPADGLSKLKRVGVTFNEEQERMVKQMVAAGDTAGAQRVMMEELRKEFGGSAEAAGKTFAGQLTILKNAFGDLQEEVGRFIVSALGPVVDAFAAWVAKVEQSGGLMSYFGDIIRDNKDLLIAIGGAIMGGLIPAFITLIGNVAGFFKVMGPWFILGAIIGLVVNEIVNHFGGWQKVMENIKPIFKDLMNAMGDMAKFAQEHTATVVTAFALIMAPQVAAAATSVVTKIGTIVTALKGLALWALAHPILITVAMSGAMIFDAYKQLQTDVQNLSDSALAAQPQIDALNQRIATSATPEDRARWTALRDELVATQADAQTTADRYSGIQGAFAAVKDFINNEILAGWNDFWYNVGTQTHVGIENIILWFSQLPGRISAWLGQLWSNVSNWFMNIFNTAVNWVSNAVNNVSNWFAQLPGRIGAWLANAWSNVSSWFANMFSTAVNWVSNTVNNVSNWFAQLPGRIGGAISSAVGWVAGGFASIWSTATGWASRIVEGVVGFFSGLGGRIASALQSAVAYAKGRLPGPVQDALGAIGLAKGGIVPQYAATGGVMWDPRGTDTVPAMLTPGEGVLQKSAMDALGPDNFKELNRGRMPVADGGVTNNFHGNIMLGDQGAVDRFFERLNRDSERAAMGAPV